MSAGSAPQNSVKNEGRAASSPSGRRLAPMSDREEHEPCTAAASKDVPPLDLGLKLAGLPSELLVILAVTLENPLALLVSKAHLSKAFCEAARDAQEYLTHIDLRKWAWRVDDAVVGAVVSKCTELTYLNISTFMAAATSPMRRWWRWPRTASSSRRSTCMAAATSPTRPWW